MNHPMNDQRKVSVYGQSGQSGQSGRSISNDEFDLLRTREVSHSLTHD